MKTIKFIILSTLIVGLSSCLKEVGPEIPTEPNSLDEIQVSSTFNFETFKNIDVILTGYTNGLVEVQSDAGIVYQKAYLQKKQQYTMQLTVPSYEKFITIRFKGKSVKIEITSDVIKWDFVK